MCRNAPLIQTACCAITLDGPEAELDCNEFLLSQDESEPYVNGICLLNGAKVTKCLVQLFNRGIRVFNGGEVSNSILTFNYDYGIEAEFTNEACCMVCNNDICCSPSPNNARCGDTTLVISDT